MLDIHGKPDPLATSNGSIARTVLVMLSEAHWTMVWWSELHRRLTVFGSSSQHNLDIHTQARVVGQIELVAVSTARNLNTRIGFSALGSPRSRKLRRRGVEQNECYLYPNVKR